MLLIVFSYLCIFIVFLAISPHSMRDNEQCSLRIADPIFHEMPFIRPLSRKGQLDTMIRYVKLNPQRLAVKRLKPGFFRVQPDISIAGYKCSGVGNAVLLCQERYAAVHVRHAMVTAAFHGDDRPLRDYYKPPQELFEACANGRMLILSPWDYDPTKQHISREDCVFLNTMAEAISICN